MRKKILFLGLLIIFFVYLPWFQLLKPLSSGDWPYLYMENIEAFRWFPDAPFLWLEPYYNLTAKIGSHLFSLPWEVTEKIFWFYPFLVIGTVSSFIFVKLILSKLGIKKYIDFFTFLGSSIFMLNTYVLMITGGGQMGVAMAYALSPFVLYLYFRILENKIIGLKNLLIFSLASAFQLMFDPRIFTVTLVLLILFFLVTTISDKTISYKTLKKLAFVNVLAIVLNLFWILPNLLHFGDFVEAAREADATFLSFASFSNSISLLHPNWPENIFGKIGFMKPEYLLIPIVSFMNLFYLNSKNKRYITLILSLSLLALLGAFFSKGTNDPFGGLYLFMSNLPGGSLFRDPTKFYLWICISYSILFPLGLYNLLSTFFKNRKLLGIFFLASAVFYLSFLIKPALYRDLTGTFSPHAITDDYVNLKKFLVAQEEEAAILWFPKRQRFGFASSTTPAFNAGEIIESAWNSPLLNNFTKVETRKLLKEYDVKYVIVPYDVQGEMFLTDRKYDENVRKNIIGKMENTSWLVPVENEKGESEFGKITVFRIKE
ncbi:MAG: hypothetical protein WD992_01175 [Candidatus Levyibacteriota bacterium]